VKQCFRCLEEKPLIEFYKHSMMADGHLNKCKPCTRADTRANRASRVEYYREYDRKRGFRVYDEKKVAARAALWKLIKAGELRKPERCEQCGATGRTEGHHLDYNRPLLVEWLCKACHSQRHTKEVEAA
jgi:hypothetical protein